ncbi:MAG: hypothetical protein U0Q19_15795 [Kineosporiaceae bacterium]
MTFDSRTDDSRTEFTAPSPAAPAAGLPAQRFPAVVVDPFGADPAPNPREHRLALVLVIAVLLGVAAGSIAYLLRPSERGPVAASGPVGSVSAPASPAAATPVATGSRGTGVSSGASGAGPAVAGGSAGQVGSAGTAGHAPSGQGSSGDNPGGLPGDGTEGDDGNTDGELPLIAQVHVLSPAGGTHTAGVPLTIKATAKHPVTGTPLPGSRLHWTFSKAGHVLRSGTGTIGSVPGYLVTSGGYHIHVEYVYPGWSGSDDVSLHVPFELKPDGPEPSPAVSGPTDEALPQPHN